MSTFDIVLALPLAYGIFQGFRKGLLQEVVSVIALVLGFVLGLKLLTSAIPVVQEFIGKAHGLLPFISFLVVFVLIILGVRLLGAGLKKILHLTPFGTFDNVLGGALGGLKWCLAISLLLYVASLAGLGISSATAQTSVIYPFVLKASPVALDGLSFLLPFIKTLFTSFKDFF